MKSFFILALVCLANCRPPISVEAPTVVQVTQVTADSIPDDAPYTPTVKWTMHVRIPGQELEVRGDTKDMPNGDKSLDGATFEWGGIKASISLESSQIRLDCSTGAAGIIHCLANEATMTATCERMIFQFTCTRM